MNIELYTNLQYNTDGNLLCKRGPGLVIANMMLDLEQDFDRFEKDHCDCIQSSIEKRGTKLLITLITEKNDIDEFIVFSIRGKGKPLNIRLRFIR